MWTQGHERGFDKGGGRPLFRRRDLSVLGSSSRTRTLPPATRALLASRSTSSESISERKTSNSETARFYSKILARSEARVNLQSRLLHAFTVATSKGSVPLDALSAL